MGFSCLQYEEVGESCTKQCSHCSQKYGRVIVSSKRKSKKKARKPNIITLRLDESVYEKIEKIAYHDHRTMNNVIETMIKNSLGVIDYDFSKAMKNPVKH